jgi:Secretory lipase/Periviscerokinin family
VVRHARSDRARRVPVGVLTGVTLLLGACTKTINAPEERDLAHAAPGTIYSIEAIGGYPRAVLRFLIGWRGLSESLVTRYGVSLYRVRYWTTGADASLTVASGLIAFPRTERLRGVISFQHGTAARRTSAPSTLDPNNGILAAAAFAGRGYLLVAADYIGLGVSAERHPYLHADSEADSVVDLLRAARTVVAAAGIAWPESLFLAGVSQGGHATLAAQRSLEAAPLDGLSVKAVASISAPFDLAAVSFPFGLEGRSDASSLYLAYMVASYANIYGEALGSVLREPYASRVPGLFDGLHDADAIIAALPADPRAMFRDEFLASYESGADNWLRSRLIENSLYEWSPRAPIRLYVGSLDDNVSVREAEVEARRLNARGGNVTTVDVGARDHFDSVLAAAPLALAWFDELSQSPNDRGGGRE